MRFIRIIAALAGAAGLIAATAAQAQEAARPPKPCITRHEMRTMIGFALPLVVDGLGKACGGTLGPDAFLIRRGPDLASRYRQENPVPWSEARAIFERVSGKNFDEIGHGGKGLKLGDAVERGIVEGVVTGMIVDKVKPRDCTTADLVVELLSPLPADNLSGLTGLLVEIAMRADAKKGKSTPITICPMRGER